MDGSEWLQLGRFRGVSQRRISRLTRSELCTQDSSGRRMHVPDAVHAELLLGAERCHDGRWFECAAAAGGD